MNRKGLFTGVVVVVIAAVVGVVVATSHSSKNENMGNMNMGQSSKAESTKKAGSSSAGSSSTATQTDAVTIKDFAFSPAKITVKVGTKVTWTNQDSIGHTVTADDPSSDAPDSPTFGKGETYSFTFNKAGTYNYHCTPHPYMKGTVVVTE